jgi:glutamine cyclotransferase
MKVFKPIALWSAVAAFAAASLGAEAATSAPVYLAAVEEAADKPAAFTQGLTFRGRTLYESSGLYGSSYLRWGRLNAGSGSAGETAAVEELGRANLPASVFAEGLAFDGLSLYVLTWKEGVVFKFDLELQTGGLSAAETFFLPGESWGLTFDGRHFWRSDGTQFLRRHRPGDFRAVGEILAVRDGARPLDLLNELEWDPTQQLILANVFMTDYVAAIDPQTGSVQFYLDCSSFARPERTAAGDNEAYLNGLAFDDSNRLWLTGKLWPRMYRVFWGPPQALAERAQAAPAASPSN